MKNILLCLILVVGIISNLIGQKITFEVQKEVFRNAEKSLILLTNEDGIILWDWQLDIVPTDTNQIFTCLIDKDLYNRLDLVVFNEYTLKKVNIGGSYFRACTYYDITEDFYVDNFKDFDSTFPKYEFRDILIEIEGVEILNNVNINHSKFRQYLRVKAKKGVLKIKYQHPLNTDFYAVLFCNDESSPKTLYIKEEDITQVLNLHWDSLNTNVKKINIPFPSKDNWYNRISAINEDTENECVFFETESRSELTNDVKFFIPQDEYFFDYKFYLSKHNRYDKRSIKYLFSGENMGLIEIDNYDFNYQIAYIDNAEFEITLDNDSLDLSISYITLSHDVFQSSTSLEDFRFSKWIVSSKSKNKLFYKFPDLYEYKRNFKTLNSQPNLQPRSVNLTYNKSLEESITITDYFDSKR